jgi:hypothetical protein
MDSAMGENAKINEGAERIHDTKEMVLGRWNMTFSFLHKTK